MLIFLFLTIFLLSFLLLFLFFLVSKNIQFDAMFNSSFECGFTSYFFSRFSFSMHYFMIGLIFLFFDLELCYLMPFFNENYSSVMIFSLFWIFVSSLVLGLVEEWKKGVLDWKF